MPDNRRQIALDRTLLVIITQSNAGPENVAHALEVAEKVGNRLPYGRGSESARRVYSHLLSRDRQGAVVLVLFQQPL